MKILTAMSRVLALASLAALAGVPAALAEPAPFHTPDELKSKCSAAGGLFYPPVSGGSYLCEGKNGAVVACGGAGEHAGTCEVIPPRTVPGGRLGRLRGDLVSGMLSAGN